MSLHKTCRNQNLNYQVKQRYIPTFVHQPIFYDQPQKAQLTRCTPTFHSTVLENDGYNVKTVHYKQQKNIQRPNTAVQKSVYINNTHEKRIQDLNPHFHNHYDSRQKWFDHTKQHLLETIKNCNVHGYSKQRKIADLSSDPVFTNFGYGLKNTNNYSYQFKNPPLNQCINCPNCPGKNACDKMFVVKLTKIIFKLLIIKILIKEKIDRQQLMLFNKLQPLSFKTHQIIYKKRKETLKLLPTKNKKKIFIKIVSLVEQNNQPQKEKRLTPDLILLKDQIQFLRNQHLQQQEKVEWFRIDIPNFLINFFNKFLIWVFLINQLIKYYENILIVDLNFFKELKDKKKQNRLILYGCWQTTSTKID